MIPGLEPTSSAELSPDERYRYVLTRRWAEGLERLTFVMLNPSTADAKYDDPTIRRCRRFASDNGFGGIDVVNLFAFRATDPKRLLAADDPIGPENNAWISLNLQYAHTVVAAWGTDGGEYGRERVALVHSIPTRRPLMCLGTTRAGHPRHPLYVRADQPLVPLTVVPL